MVRRGLTDSRSEGRRLILDNRVTVNGAPATKAARQVSPGDAVEVLGTGPRYVSRGGLKLEAALDSFDVDVGGRRVIDVGSSTGGFTDCVLSRGAAEVVALDVGRNQLHERLRRDPRVRVHERTNVRGVDPTAVGAPFDVVVADLSFVSVRLVAADLVGLAAPGADLVVLVKPQFESGRAEADRAKGVIRDPEVWRRAIESAGDALASAGAAIMGAVASPITGAAGNVEFFLHGRHDGSETGAEVSALARAAVATVPGER